jgi:hypothetical protein
MTQTRHVSRVALACAFALLVAGSALVGAQAPAALDINGTWIFTVETSGGAGTPTVTLKAEGEKVTGHISSATFGEQDLTGSLKGPAIEFKFSGGDVGGEVIYKGTVESRDSIKGTIDIAEGQITGTFTAARKP